MRTLTINGHKGVKCLTIAELARLGGKSAITLRKWETFGWLPPANFRAPGIELKDGTMREGERLYTYEFAMRMAEHIQKVQKGVTIPQTVINALYQIMKEERLKFTTHA